jgi:vacuolar protein sorting-associated protein 53
MGVYVQHQDKWVYSLSCSTKFLRSDQRPRAIADLLAPHRGSKPRASLDTNQSHSTADDGEQTAVVVHPSSTELFYFYGQTLDGCATLSTGKPLFDMLEVFKKWLRVYAGE